MRIATVAVVAVIFGGGSGASSQTRSRSLRGPEAATTLDWPVYGGQAAADHYSSLSQINRKNVRELQLAWKFDAEEEGGLETSPIIVGRVLYAYTATQKVIALDAASGKLIWTTPASRARIPYEAFPTGPMAKKVESSPQSRIFCMPWRPTLGSRCRSSEKAPGSIYGKTCAATTGCSRSC